MKKLLAILLSVFLCATAFAGEDYEKDNGYSDIQSYDFDLSVESEDGQVEVEWDEFEGDDFKWYKFVYSQTDSNPTYPEDKSQYFWDDAERDEADIWLAKGDYYVRLCAITHDNERYCSEVQKLSVEKKDYEKDDEDYDDEDEEKKEYAKKQAVKKAILANAAKKVDKKVVTNTSNLSERMQNRVDAALERFIERLEAKDYDDEKMITTIDQVIDRLEWFKNQEKYAVIVEYMIEVLEEYKEKYSDNFGDLEDILNDF